MQGYFSKSFYIHSNFGTSKHQFGGKKLQIKKHIFSLFIGEDPLIFWWNFPIQIIPQKYSKFAPY